MALLRPVKRKRGFTRFNDDDDEDDYIQMHWNIVERERKFLRKRWDSKYLVGLAGQEGSFVSEYRLDPQGFDILSTLLEPRLARNLVQAKNSLAGSGTQPISTESRLGAALIILAGGRSMEAMRTHGIPQCTSYTNLHEVVDAINSVPELAIRCPNDLASLKKRAKEFAAKSEKGLFKYCTGAIDGIAIRVNARSTGEVRNLNFHGWLRAAQ